MSRKLFKLAMQYVLQNLKKIILKTRGRQNRRIIIGMIEELSADQR